MSSSSSTNQSSSSSKKKRKRGKEIPKPGEEGYMSPTQLRNARKRKAKKNKAKNMATNEVNKELTQKFPSNSTKFSSSSSSSSPKPSTSPKPAPTPTDRPQRYISPPLKSPRIRAAQAFFASKSLPFPLIIGPLKHWRTSSKFAVRPSPTSPNNLTIGLFEGFNNHPYDPLISHLSPQPGSHNIVPTGTSEAHHTSINEVVSGLEKECNSASVRAYDEVSGEGELKYAFANVDRKTGKVQLTLVLNRGHGEELSSQMQSLTKSLPSTLPLLSSLYLHFNKSQSKHQTNIFSFAPDSWSHIHGPRTIEEVLSDIAPPPPYDLTLNFPPNVFRQASPTAFQGIIGSIRSSLSSLSRSDLRILELYGGVGTIGLNLLDYASKLTSSDENPHNLRAFNDSVHGMGKKLRKKCEYVQKSAEGMVDGGYLSKDSYDVCVIDPPRKGCNHSVLSSLCSRTQTSLRHLIYVSCGFDAFVKDCEVLEKEGGWKCNKAEGHVLFPRSDAIETLAIFERS